DSLDIPVTKTDDGQEIYFPIEIAQYGLGAFDIYLENNDEHYLSIAKSCAQWLIDNQDECGGWKTFSYIYPDHPYSSMAQSEAACLFMRMYTVLGSEEYLTKAKAAIDFMLIPLENGGCTQYVGDEIYLCEHTDPSRTVVLNGWIFSLWSLFDYVKLTSDDAIKNIYDKTVSTMIAHLSDFDCKYWSLYDLSGRITSPFYHDLHLAQLKVMYDLTGYEDFHRYYQKWSAYSKSFFGSKRAFVTKAIQKLTEKL
ncbi:MAG: thioredoxin, partial [Clostridia bacterium]|nr:thioredoxin [Clostridia bacterium]